MIDWRSGAGGANRTVHLFLWPFGGSEKCPACGIRVTGDYRRRTDTHATRCRECLYRARTLGMEVG